MHQERFVVGAVKEGNFAIEQRLARFAGQLATGGQPCVDLLEILAGRKEEIDPVTPREVVMIENDTNRRVVRPVNCSGKLDVQVILPGMYFVEGPLGSSAFKKCKGQTGGLSVLVHESDEQKSVEARVMNVKITVIELVDPA